jgi:predicted DNA-binding transcriptional regulator AlpA
MPDEKRVLDIRDVALQLRSSESSVKRLVEAGQLRKPRHILTKPVWFQADVDEYLRRLDRGEFEKPES